MSECNCKTWASDNIGLDMLLGHHHKCPFAPPVLQAMQTLIAELCCGIKTWAADEDGVHPAVWDAYVKASAICGDFDPIRQTALAGKETT